MTHPYMTHPPPWPISLFRYGTAAYKTTELDDFLSGKARVFPWSFIPPSLTPLLSRGRFPFLCLFSPPFLFLCFHRGSGSGSVPAAFGVRRRAGKIICDIHYWIGDESTQDEYNGFDRHHDLL